MNDAYIPIGIAFSLAVILVSYFFLQSRNKADVQKTIRKAIDQGVQLSPELIEKLSTVRSPKVADLRKGIILCSIAIAGLVAGIISGHIQNFAAFSVFPMMLGGGFLTVWKLNQY